MASYQPVSFNTPSYDYGADISQIERRRAMAQALQQQGLQPVEQQPVAPGQFATPISPFQGAAKLAQVFAAKRQQDKADEQQRKLAQTSQSNLASVLMNAQKAASGMPGTPLSEDASGNVTAPQPAVAGDMSKAASLYMQHPQTAQLGAQMMQKEIENQQRQRLMADLVKAPTGNGATPGGPWNPDYAAQSSNPLSGIDPRLLGMTLSGDAEMSKLGMHLMGRGETSGRVFYDQNNQAYTVDKSGRRIDIAGTKQGISPADQYKIPLQQAQTYFETGLKPGPLGAPQGQAPAGWPGATPPAPAAPQAQAPNAVPVPAAPSPSPLQITPKQRAKLEEERPQVEFASTSVLNGLDNMKRDIATLKSHPGLTNITGPVAGRTPNLSGDATNAQAVLDTLKSRASVQELQRMRDASKTGGAVGNVTEKEWPRLEAQLAALQQSQTTTQFRENLAAAEETINRMMGAVETTYKGTYGKTLEWKPRTQPTTPLNEKERQELEALRLKHGRRP